MKTLYFSKDFHGEPIGGRQKLSRVNFYSLLSLRGSNLLEYKVKPYKIGDWKLKFCALFFGHIDGLSGRRIDEALSKIELWDVRQVFVDGSNFGEFVFRLKKAFPSVEIITFFHNVEACFFWDAFKNTKSLHALGILFVNTLAEWKSVKYSDKIVCLSDRDSKMLKKIYFRYATHLSPMALEDQYFNPDYVHVEPFMIFVGGNFYANQDGIRWFVREVMPSVNLPLFIIGHGFEMIRDELEQSDRVFVVGSVDELSSWYARAKFVVAPIFNGSGMKTKVAEALMYGKKIVGTPEAFSGYEDVADNVGWVCQSKEEFTLAINEASSQIIESFDVRLRELFEKHYSQHAAKERLARIIS